MLFNSPIFIFAFLPITVFAFFAIGRASTLGARIWLSAASLFYYGWWNPRYVFLIVGSLLVNYYFGLLLQNDSRRPRPLSRRTILILGLVWNVGLLSYFKYFMFVVKNINELFDTRFFIPHIILPLAISFFTFQKIAYLVDSYKGKVKECPFIDFSLFVTFFPQLIAGPIVHYSDVLPQFRERSTYRFHWDNFSEGLSGFLLGLAKKVVLADEFGRYADAAFNGAAHGGHPSLAAAWVGMVAYTLQLYFDFSGYSDMALGLGRMMNIALPVNFNSPYKAASIVEFWRRWHMTLSRFLRDYIYIPLGGNRLGELRRYANLMITMVIGGIWHGAGWTFLCWGALHGLYLCINQLWTALMGRWRPRGWSLFSHVLTFVAVMLAWVLFRSADFRTAGRMLAGLVGANGAVLPDQLLAILPPLRHVFVGAGEVPYLADSTVMGTLEAVVMLGIGLWIVFDTPNLYQMSRRQRITLVALTFAFTLQKVLFAGDLSPFLYFQF